MKLQLNLFSFLLLAVVLLKPLQAQAQIVAAPQDANTIVTPTGNTIDITGGTRTGTNLFHSFEQFGVNPSQIANFQSNPAIHNIFGRVVGGNASIVDGVIQVTGGSSNLYLMNPAGIVFGAGARLNVPGAFTATTANGIGFGNAWLNAVGANVYNSFLGSPSQLGFSMPQPGAILNAGQLAVRSGQHLSLIGGTVTNTGTLTAPGGEITIASVPGNSLVQLNQGAFGFQVQPIGSTPPPALLTVSVPSLPELLQDSKLNAATGVTVKPDGAIVLTGGQINPQPATTITSGKVDVSSAEQGGSVGIFGDRVALLNANIDASGGRGGGTVLIGGDYQGRGTVPNADRTFINSASTIRADAQNQGNGGRVIVWADQATEAYGNISVRGGNQAGNGGFVEVSGKQGLIYEGNTDLGAPNGSFGTLLLDPDTITITDGNSGTGANDGAVGAGDSALVFSTALPNNFVLSRGRLESLTGFIQLSANSAITINDLASNQLNLQASSAQFFVTNGTFTMNPGDTIRTQGGTVQIGANTINLGNISTSGGNINLDGRVILNGNTTLSTGTSSGNIVHSGGRISSDSGATPRNLDLQAGGTFNLNNNIGGFGDSERLNNVTINAGTLTFDPNGRIRAIGNVALQSPNNLTVSNANIEAGGNLTLASQGQLALVNVFNLQGGGDLTLQGQSITAQTSALATSPLFRDIRFIAPTGTVTIDRSNIRAGRDMSLTAQTVTYPDGGQGSTVLNAGRDLTVQAQDATLRGTLEAGRDLNANAPGSLQSAFGNRLIAGQSLNLNTALVTPGTVSFSSSTVRATGGNLTVRASSISSSFSGSSVEAGQNLDLRTQQDLVLDQLTFKAGGDLTIRSLNGSITKGFNSSFTQANLLGDVALQADLDINLSNSQTEATQNLTLNAGRTIRLDQEQLKAGQNIQLIAQDTIDVKDQASVFNDDPASGAAIVNAGQNLLVQGNQAVTIDAGRNPLSVFQSGNDLTLVSDGTITGNVRFASGGNFSTRRVLGGAADFQQTSPNFDTVISANGDITFGNYEGVALKIEATGSITGGNITITGINPSLTGTDPDIALLRTERAVILRAGVPALQNAPDVPSVRPVNGTTFTSTAGVTPPKSITVGNISAARATDGADSVILSAPGGITAGAINSDGGNVRLRSTEGSIIVSTINTGAFGGGGVDIDAAQLFRATGTFSVSFQDTAGDGTLIGNPNIKSPAITSIRTSSTGSPASPLDGKITIRQGGAAFRENYGSTPLAANESGTAGLIIIANGNNASLIDSFQDKIFVTSLGTFIPGGGTVGGNPGGGTGGNPGGGTGGIADNAGNAVQSAQRPVNDPSNDPACDPNTIASANGAEPATDDRTTRAASRPAASRPCTPAQTTAPILKIRDNPQSRLRSLDTYQAMPEVIHTIEQMSLK